MNNRLPGEIDKLVAYRIAELRKDRGLPQQALADRLGVTFQQFQKYENGENRITAGRLYELARELGATISQLYSGADELFGARSRGVAEEGTEFRGATDQDSIELLVAFKAIGKPDVRKSILATAKKEAEAAPKKKKRRRD